MYEVRVCRGLKLLKKQNPNWFKKINIRKVEIEDIASILQLIDSKYGTHVNLTRESDYFRGREILKEIWITKISKLKGIKVKPKK